MSECGDCDYLMAKLCESRAAQQDMIVALDWLKLELEIKQGTIDKLIPLTKGGG